MRRPHGSHRVVVAAAALAACGWIGLAAGAPDPEIGALVARAGERVAAYYQRAQQLVCIERSTVVPIQKDWSPDVGGFARTVESELRVELDASQDGEIPEAHVTREIRRINGREPRPRDLKDRSGCTDPTPVSPEPLAFLLPSHREEYTFTSVRQGHEGNRAALVIDFGSAQHKSRAQLIEDERGHDDCFDWKGPIAVSGRFWIDASSYDVLRLDRHVSGPTDVSVPPPLQRKYRFDPWLTLERDDVSLRYKPVAFTNPDETVLLPESFESTTVFRTSLQSIRTTQSFSDYKRFLTQGSFRVIKRGGQ